MIFYDLDATLGITDVEAMGRKLGEIDWQRTAAFWSDMMRDKEVRGKMVTTFIGGGYESRQTVRRKAHEHLGTWDRLQATLGSSAKAEEQVDEPAAA